MVLDCCGWSRASALHSDGADSRPALAAEAWRAGAGRSSSGAEAHDSRSSMNAGLKGLFYPGKQSGVVGKHSCS